jgi:hypothetical protein
MPKRNARMCALKRAVALSVRAKKWITCILKVHAIRLCPQSELNLLKVVSELKATDKINMLRSMIGG